MNNIFFLLSFSRSGSTLLSKILNNNKNITVLNESWIFQTLSILGWKKLNYNKQRYILHVYNKSLKIYKNHSLVSNTICKRETISVICFYKKIINYNINPIGEKNPVNILYHSYLKNNFEFSKFIFLIRDPIAIANSYRNRWFKDVSFNYFLFRVTTLIKTYFLSYQEFCNDKDFMPVRYEDLVNDPFSSLNELCNYLGVSFDKNMLDNINSFSFESEFNNGHENLTNNINTNSIDKYNNQFSKEQLESISYLLRDVTSFFGYPTEYIKPSKFLLKIERKVNNRLIFNKSYLKLYFKRIKYYLFYLKFTITR